MIAEDTETAAADGADISRWQIHTAASKRGKDLLIEEVGYRYSVGKT